MKSLEGWLPPWDLWNVLRGLLWLGLPPSVCVKEGIKALFAKIIASTEEKESEEYEEDAAAAASAAEVEEDREEGALDLGAAAAIAAAVSPFL